MTSSFNFGYACTCVRKCMCLNSVSLTHTMTLFAERNDDAENTFWIEGDRNTGTRALSYEDTLRMWAK